jgi:hypothetical protein
MIDQSSYLNRPQKSALGIYVTIRTRFAFAELLIKFSIGARKRDVGERAFMNKQTMNRRGLAEQRAANELVVVIRKLRWMGLEDEARRLEDDLARRRVTTDADSVVAVPRETD